MLILCVNKLSSTFSLICYTTYFLTKTFKYFSFENFKKVKHTHEHENSDSIEICKMKNECVPNQVNSLRSNFFFWFPFQFFSCYHYIFKRNVYIFISFLISFSHIYCFSSSEKMWTLSFLDPLLLLLFKYCSSKFNSLVLLFTLPL